MITIPISPAELIDKLTILEIKLAEIEDEKKLSNIQHEYSLLLRVYSDEVQESPELLTLRQRLFDTNKMIWDSENHVRKFWNDDKEFNVGAKQSHFYNDERAKIKQEINELLESNIIEEKSHPEYKHDT